MARQPREGNLAGTTLPPFGTAPNLTCKSVRSGQFANSLHIFVISDLGLLRTIAPRYCQAKISEIPRLLKPINRQNGRFLLEYAASVCA